MTSLNNTLSNIYNNLYTFFEYRELYPLDKKIDNDEFIKYIYNNEYFIINTVSNIQNLSNEDKQEINDNILNMKYKNDKNFKITYIVLFHYTNEINSKTPEFKKIINTLSKTNMLYDMIIITRNPLATHVKNYIKTINNKPFDIKNPTCNLTHTSICNCFKLNIFTYVYDLFIIIIPKHILSNKHTILSKEEGKHILENVLLCKKSNLPKIKIYDPQIIWSPGYIGDIVKILRNDDVSAQSLYYRLITP
jgi:DNA-directed RNA polymerase subunit H (RpoH/RPB5)